MARRRLNPPRAKEHRCARSSAGRRRKDEGLKKIELESHIPFNPGDAIESLRAEIVQIEAFAHAASEAVTRLPYPSARAARRAYDRVYALVMKVADDASTAANRGDELVAALADHLRRRRADT